MTRRPVRALEALRERTRSFGPDDVAPGGKDPLAGFEAELVELRVACDVSPDADVTFDLRGVPVRYDAAKQELAVAGHTTAWPATGGKLALIVYLDRTCVEVFSQDGLLYAPVAALPQESAGKVRLAVERGVAKGVRGEAHALRSSWSAR